MASYGFHPDALLEDAEAAAYYLREASPEIAQRFVETIESGVTVVVSAPDRYPIVEQPEIRRHVSNRFPYLLTIDGSGTGNGSRFTL